MPPLGGQPRPNAIRRPSWLRPPALVFNLLPNPLRHRRVDPRAQSPRLRGQARSTSSGPASAGSSWSSWGETPGRCRGKLNLRVELDGLLPVFFVFPSSVAGGCDAKKSPRSPTFCDNSAKASPSPQGAPLEASGSCPVRHAPLHPAAARSACPRSSKRTSPRSAGSQVSDHFGGVNATSTR